MRVIDSLGRGKKLINSSIVTLGNFDGVHRGHRELIRRLVELSQQRKCTSVVLTFDPHPMQVLYPDRDFQKLFPFNDQVEQMEKLGVDVFIRHPFTAEFSKLKPEEFLQDWLFCCLQPQTLVVGYDFAFGSGRQGTLNRLQEICRKNGVNVEVIPPFEQQGLIISSSKIREFVRRGEMSLAQDFLGRPFYLMGKVIHGDRRGRSIGFPTANLDVAGSLKPRVGVYVTETSINGKIFASMTNVGWNPTVSENRDRLKIETHIFNYDQEIYGQEVKLSFLAFLREEKKFSSLNQLKSQLELDRTMAKEYFNEHSSLC